MVNGWLCLSFNAIKSESIIMIIEQPPVNYTRATPLVERRGLIIVNTGDGKGKAPQHLAWHCVLTDVVKP